MEFLSGETSIIQSSSYLGMCSLNHFLSSVDQASTLDHLALSIGVIAFSSSRNLDSVDNGVFWVIEERVGVLKMAR